MSDRELPPIYRMPVGFGPALGPRQSPDGTSFNGRWSKNTTFSMTYRTDPERVSAVMPPGFEASPEGLVTVNCLFNEEFAWLAGRGYNWIEVVFPATYRGQEDTVEGDFVAVMWESEPDPVLPGREELGLPKLFSTIPPWHADGGSTAVSASWDTFEFFAATWHGLDFGPWPAELEATAPITKGGLGVGNRPRLYYKYFPRTGAWGTADVAYATMSPPANYDIRLLQNWSGTGDIAFMPATWEQLPTMAHIVNPLAEMPVHEIVSASAYRVLLAFNDLRDQKVLT